MPATACLAYKSTEDGGPYRVAAGDPCSYRRIRSVDPDLLDFVRSQEFRGLNARRSGTTRRISGCAEVLVFARGAVEEATERDLRPTTGTGGAPRRRIRSGSAGRSGNREAAAFTKLFRWAKVVPLPVDVSRTEDRAADSVSSRVSWLTPRTCRGCGRTSGCAAILAPGCLGRVGGADGDGSTSFVQLMLSSGLRRQEGGSLLTFELPTQAQRGTGGIATGRSRER